jgi:DNA (cytosine-5)-methyltransferase 1
VLGHQLTFIDLFAGIGGIRFAFEAAGCQCVFSSEWDKDAQKTYAAFFGETPQGDIRKIDAKDIGQHDILTAGFPCQPFSLAGVSKKNALGRKHGFEDATQGTLFFDIARILEYHQPPAFLLENVKNLRSHDKGRTFAVISETLRGLGYDFTSKVIDSRYWVPQHRERVYIVGFRTDLGLLTKLDNAYPTYSNVCSIGLGDVLEPPAAIKRRYGDKYTLGPGTWKTLLRHRAHHAELGNGFGYGLISPPFKGKITRTLSARYHKDGAEILIEQPRRTRPRRLTPLEVCRLQGFPSRTEDFFNGTKPQPVADTQVYRQFGNAVSVPVVSEIARRIVQIIASC